MRHQDLREQTPPTVYVPITQGEVRYPPTMLVRGPIPQQALLAAVYRELSRLGPAPALSGWQSIGRYVDDSIFRERMLATLGGFFGGLALLLAAIGLYGVVTYGTARRANEIGIRIALGASRAGVLWMVLRDALALVAAGLAIGLPASLAAARTVESALFEVKPADPFTLAATAAVLAGVSFTAAFLPARRAAGADPMRALRHD